MWTHSITIPSLLFIDWKGREEERKAGRVHLGIHKIPLKQHCYVSVATSKWLSKVVWQSTLCLQVCGLV